MSQPACRRILVVRVVLGGPVQFFIAFAGKPSVTFVWLAVAPRCRQLGITGEGAAVSTSAGGRGELSG